MESKRTATTYFIPPGKFLLMENALGNPDLIQSSVSSDCRVTIVDKANFPLDELEQWPTFRLVSADIQLKLGSGSYYIYIVVPTPDNEETTTAFISYNTSLVDRDGYEVLTSTDENGNSVTSKGVLLGKEGFKYYECGVVSRRGGNSSVTTNPEGQGRLIEVDLGVTPSPSTLPGDLNDFDEIFQLDKVDPSNPSSWLLSILTTVKTMVARMVRITGSLVFGQGENERAVTDVATSADKNNEQKIADDVLATTAWVDSQFEGKYLRKDKDDRSTGIIASDKGFEAGKFNAGATGAACYQDKDGNWHIETDHLKVRKKASITEVEIETTYHVGGQQISTGASMIVDYVLEMASCYRCYFLKRDNNGRVTTNKWKPKDQAYCNTFNLVKQEDGTLGNHYLWRLVNATSNETADEAGTRTFGDVTINTADYHFTDLSKTVFAEGSDIPKALDEIVLLGHQGNDESRQGCIIVAGAGEGSPYIYEFTGINSFVLPEPETKIKPGDNKFTGVMRIQNGSTGASNLEDLPDEVFKAVHVGAVNLLRNSGFTGDFQSEDMVAPDQLDSGSELFSNKLDKWDGDAVAYTDSNAVSGYSVQLGSLSQSVKELIAKDSYVVSFKARGSVVNVSCGDYQVSQNLTSGYAKYSFKFDFSGSKVFSIEGNARICDLQLERGTIATDWNPSPYDNDKSFAEFQSLKYLQDAIVNGNTTVLGGLILSSMINLGNYKEGKMQKVNAGVSGIYNDDDDVAFWAGGTFEEAIKTVVKFKNNPRYRPTDAEWLSLANFAVSHGGDIFLRGYIYALGGYFRGAVEIANGKIMLNDDGSGWLANKNIRWTEEGIMYRKAPENIEWKSVTDFTDKRITFDKGLYFELGITYWGTEDIYTLPTPEYDLFTIFIKAEMPSRSSGCATLYSPNSFRVYNGEEFVNVDYITLEVGSTQYELVYQNGIWNLRNALCGISNGIAYVGRQDKIVIGENVESRTEIDKEKLKVPKVEVTGNTDDSIKTNGGIKASGKVVVGSDGGTQTVVESNKVTSERMSITSTEDDSISSVGGVTAKNFVFTGSKSKGTFLAAPSSSDGIPTFRSITDADIEGYADLKKKVETLELNDTNKSKKIESLESSVDTLTTSYSDLSKEVKALKESVTDLANNDTEAGTKITALETSVKALEERIAALEKADGETT